MSLGSHVLPHQIKGARCSCGKCWRSDGGIECSELLFYLDQCKCRQDSRNRTTLAGVYIQLRLHILPNAENELQDDDHEARALTFLKSSIQAGALALGKT